MVGWVGASMSKHTNNKSVYNWYNNIYFVHNNSIILYTVIQLAHLNNCVKHDTDVMEPNK